MVYGTVPDTPVKATPIGARGAVLLVASAAAIFGCVTWSHINNGLTQESAKTSSNEESACDVGYENNDFVVWSHHGHDIRTVRGPKSLCEEQCCMDTNCVGFTRDKRVSDQFPGATCWLKKDAPEEDRTHGNPRYHIFLKEVPPVDCVGEWDMWSECSNDCGKGTKTREYHYKVWAENGGAECPFRHGTRETETCNEDHACATFSKFKFNLDPAGDSHGLRNWDCCVQLSEIALYDHDNKYVQHATVSNAGGHNPSNEQPGNAYNQIGNPNSKWLDFNFGDLVMDFGHPVNVASYNWMTANDAPGRDPTKWQLSGSNDGKTWGIVDDTYAATAFAPPEARHEWVGPFPVTADGSP